MVATHSHHHQEALDASLNLKTCRLYGDEIIMRMPPSEKVESTSSNTFVLEYVITEYAGCVESHDF